MSCIALYKGEKSRSPGSAIIRLHPNMGHIVHTVSSILALLGFAWLCLALLEFDLSFCSLFDGGSSKLHGLDIDYT